MLGISMFVKYKETGVLNCFSSGFTDKTDSILKQYIHTLTAVTSCVPKSYSEFNNAIHNLRIIHRKTHTETIIVNITPPASLKTGVDLAEYIYYTHTPFKTHFCKIPALLNQRIHIRTRNKWFILKGAKEVLMGVSGDIYFTILEIVINLIMSSCRTVTPAQWMADRGCLKATLEHALNRIHTGILKNKKKALKSLLKVESGRSYCILYNNGKTVDADLLYKAAKLGNRCAQYTYGSQTSTDLENRLKYQYRAASQGIRDSAFRLCRYYQQDTHSEGIALLYLHLTAEHYFSDKCAANVRYWSLQQRLFIFAVTKNIINSRDILFGQNSRVSHELQRRSHTHLLTDVNKSGRPGLILETSLNGIPAYYISRILSQRFFWV